MAKSFNTALRYIVLLLVYMVVASLVLNATIGSLDFHNYYNFKRASLSAMVYGTADRPFVYRALAPVTVRLLSLATPEPIKQKICGAFRNVGRYSVLDQRNGLEDGYAVEYFYTLLILYLSIIAIAFTMRALIRAFYKTHMILADFLPVLLIVFLPVLHSCFIYDYPNLLMFSLCFLLMYQNRWRLFYPVFILACFSKETSILLPFAFLLNNSELKKEKNYWKHLIVQVLIWLVVFLSLRFIYKGNAGQMLEFHLLDVNLGLLKYPMRFFKLDAILLPQGINIPFYGIITTMVFWGWKSKPRFLRKSIFIVVPLIALALLFGVIDETRGYYEAMPIVFLLIIPTLLNLSGQSDIHSIHSEG